VEAGECPLVDRSLQVRPPGGLPGSGAGPEELAGGEKPFPPLPQEKAASRQRGAAHGLHPCASPAHKASTNRKGAEQGAHGEAFEAFGGGESQEHDFVGADLGLSSFAVFSDGTRIEAPRPLAKRLKLLKRRSKQLSRKEKGSNNGRKAALALARTKPVIVVEDLNVKGLSQGFLSRSVADMGWGTFLRMLEYKAGWHGATLVVVPRSFPSTRRCSQGRMPLSQRVFRCEACGLELDRDRNAALSLRAYGLAHPTGSTGSSPGSDAPGDPSGGGTGLRAGSTSYGKRPIVSPLRGERDDDGPRNGAPLEPAAERLGHSNPNITLGVYRHLLEHERRGWVLDPEDLLKPRAKA